MAKFIEYTDPIWRGLNMRELGVDEAYINPKSYYSNKTYLYSLSDECYTCPYTKVQTLRPLAADMKRVFKLNINHPQSFKIIDRDAGRYAFDNESALCGVDEIKMKEFGVYNLTLYANGTCSFVTDKEGVDIYYSMGLVFLLVAALFIVLKIVCCVWNSYKYDEVAAHAQMDEAVTSSTTTIETTEKQKNRMRSLDTFRGMAIVLMIFVNSGGGDYWWIEHAPWNGLHLADIVFPSFLWIMGVCIPLSIKSQLGRGATKFTICKKILWRSIKLFAIGLCLNSINATQLEKLRIMGVLQRFGIAFLVCGILHTLFGKIHILMPQQIWKRRLYDLIILKGELAFMLAMIGIYLGITFGLPVPDCPTGYLGPGGKHGYAAYPNCIGGATGYIDLQVLGNSHLYQHPTAKYIYDSQAFDPEGIFGCVLTIVQVILGLIAGMIILVHTEWRSRITRWLCWSLSLAVIGGSLCLFTQENGVIPVNKNLWSLSFVFVTASIAFVSLSVLYFIVDVQQWWTGYPFEACGKNAIIMYVGHSVLHMLPWHWRIGEMNTHFLRLLEATWNTLLWIGIALFLNAKKIYYNL